MVDRRTLIWCGVWATAIAGVGVWGDRELRRYELGGTDREGWQPMFWPFRPDAHPPGRAWYRGDTEVYVRVKFDLCSDCETGVISDEAVDRATDIDLLDSSYRALAPGNKIQITDLFGRSRRYRLGTWYGGSYLAEGIAVAYKCDLVTAIVVANVEDPETRQSAIRFLESNTPQVWVNKQLDGR
jgi:hypothetical protein